MARRRPDGIQPNWSRLCKLASAQVGYFTGAQALLVGYSPQLLNYYIQKSMIERTHRGIFRLTRFPHDGQEELIALWLWGKGEGVFSHETALMLHGLLLDVPEELTLTLPPDWFRRRLQPPPRSVLYYGQVPARDLSYKEPFSFTAPLRSLSDCILAQEEGAEWPGWLKGAVRHAVKRELVTRAALQRSVRARRRFRLVTQ